MMMIFKVPNDSTVHNDGKWPHLKIFENISKYVVSKEFGNNLDITKVSGAVIKEKERLKACIGGERSQMIYDYDVNMC
jgi:hypothetical protein